MEEDSVRLWTDVFIMLHEIERLKEAENSSSGLWTRTAGLP